MKRLRRISIIFGLILATAFFISCGASSDAGSTSLDQVLISKDEVPRISAEELKARLDNGEAITIADTRNAFAFKSSHIAGAISVPGSEVEAHLDELPRDQEIVFYCS